MMNPIDLSSAVREANAAALDGTSEPVPDLPGAGTPGDLVEPSATALLALAYVQGPAVGRFTGPGAAASGAGFDDELERRYGPQLALVRAALPTEMQAQFSVQLLVASGSPPGGEPAAEEGRVRTSDDDLGALVHTAVLGNDAASLSHTASRLARYVAARGAAPVAAALQLAGSPFAFAAPATTPQATHDTGDRRAVRREDRPPRRDRDSPEQPAAASPPDAEAADADLGYTIDDIVRFSDVTVAIHKQDVRSFPWPS